MKRGLAPLLALGLGLAAPAAARAAQSHLLVVVGLGGEPKYTETFHELALLMVASAEKTLGVPAANMAYLGEQPAHPGLSVYKGRSTRENLEKAFAAVGSRAQPGDSVFVLLIGHGSGRSGESRFNLPGPDMSAADFAPLIAPLSAQDLVFVNAASASGDFVKALAGPRRTIITATKSGMEGNETMFPHYFVDAFAALDKADTDKDRRVSVLEAFTYARREVQRFYEKERRLLTEHALLDDDGDGVGTGTPGEKGDGARARAAFLGTGGDPGAAEAGAGADPRTAELFRARSDLERKIADLRARKDSLPEETYQKQLEALLLELARSDALLRRKDGSR